MENVFFVLEIAKEMCNKSLEYLWNRPETLVYVVIILGLLCAFLLANQKNNNPPE